MGELGTMMPERSFSPAHESVAGVCTHLHRAYRDLRLYPPDHPTARQSLERLAEAVVTDIQRGGSLALDVEEDQLLHEGEPVYSHQASQDNLAFILFRDGIRSLSFNPGLGIGEVEDLVDCLAHADDLVNVDHDLATALWERDFAHIDYTVVDPFLGEETLREGAVDVLRETALRRLERASPASMSAADAATDALQVAEHVRVEPDSLALSPAEVELCERLAEDSPDLLKDFALVLLEVVGGPSGYIARDHVLARSLAFLIESYLMDRDLEGLSFVCDRLMNLQSQGHLPSEFVDLVMETGLTSEGLSRILEGIDRVPAEDANRIEEFLVAARQWIFPALLGLLAETGDRNVRKSVLAVLEAGGGVSESYLSPLLQDPRWYVVRNAVQLAAGSRDPQVLGRLEHLLRHPDVRVRREVVRTFDTVGGEREVDLVAECLDDEDSSVRTMAARSLGRRGTRHHEAVVLAHVEGREFETRPGEEIEAFLFCLAALAKDRAVPLLNTLWRRKRLLGRAGPARLAAVQALGTIAGPDAHAALKAAAKSGDAQVKRIALRTLGELDIR